MKEISEGLRPGIPKQPFNGFLCQGSKSGAEPTRQEAERSGTAEMHLRDTYRTEILDANTGEHVLNVHKAWCWLSCGRALMEPP